MQGHVMNSCRHVGARLGLIFQSPARIVAPCTHSSTHSPTRSLTHSPHPLTHPTRSLTHPTHPLTHHTPALLTVCASASCASGNRRAVRELRPGRGAARGYRALGRRDIKPVAGSIVSEVRMLQYGFLRVGAAV